MPAVSGDAGVAVVVVVFVEERGAELTCVGEGPHLR